MDAQVDNDLGDSIWVRYRATMNDPPTRLVGFLTSDASEPGAALVDPMKLNWHCKIAMSLLPDGPAAIGRLTGAPLRNQPYKPSTDTIDNDGRYWIFDLQKAT